MNHAKNKTRACILIAGLFVFAASLPAQHITPEEAMRRDLAEYSVEELVEAIRSFPPHDSQFLELSVMVIQQIGEKGQGSEVARQQLQNTLQQGMDRVARINNREIDYWRVRAESALALGRIGDREATPNLIRAAMNDKDIMVQMCAIRALGMLGDPAAVPRLMDMLENTTIDRVANEIVFALGEIGDRRALPILLATTQRNFSASVHRRAREAMRKLQD